MQTKCTLKANKCTHKAKQLWAPWKKRKGKKKKERQTVLYSGAHLRDTVHTQATLLDTCIIAKVLILHHILGNKQTVSTFTGGK